MNDSVATRWGALAIVAFMMAAYYVNDVMAPLKNMLESDLAWTSTEFGFFTGAQLPECILLMLIWRLILDRFGIRFTGGKVGSYPDGGVQAMEYYATAWLEMNHLYLDMLQYLSLLPVTYFGVETEVVVLLF